MTEESTDDVIPLEILADEILARFPATNIQSTLKLVCKDWLNLVSRPGFARRQLLLGSNRYIRILVPQANGIINIDYKKHGCVSSKTKEFMIPFPPNIYCGGKGAVTPRILGSFDGLILLADKYPKSFVVFNPSTGMSELFAQPKQSSKHLVMPLPDIYSSWFGRHPTTGEYVLVLCQKSSEILTVVELHSFTRENKLRVVQSCSVHHYSDVLSPTFCYGQERGILLDRVVHWAAHWSHTYTVSGYHIEDNEYFEISPPSQTDFKLGVMDGCLLSINKRIEDGVFEVWVMKKETRVWTKYTNIEGECNSKFEILYPLSFFPNGDLIMECDSRILTRYDFNCNKATFLNRYYPPTRVEKLISKAIVCADSLVSPAIVMEQAEL